MLLRLFCHCNLLNCSLLRTFARRLWSIFASHSAIARVIHIGLSQYELSQKRRTIIRRKQWDGTPPRSEQSSTIALAGTLRKAASPCQSSTSRNTWEMISTSRSSIMWKTIDNTRGRRITVLIRLAPPLTQQLERTSCVFQGPLYDSPTLAG